MNMSDTRLARRGDMIHEFEQLLAAPHPPDLTQFVALHGAISDRDLAELVLIDQSARWAKGERPELEEYLKRFPQLADREDELVELLAHEYTLRQSHGADPFPEQYLDRVPALRTRMQDHFRVCDALATKPLDSQGGELGGGQDSELPGKYCLLEVHGEGGLGRIWRAHDKDLHREVVIKELRGELANRSEVRERFLREARVTGQLEHPNIVPVYELIERPDRDQPAYVMRFVRGQSLSEAIRKLRAHESGREDSVAQLRLLNAFISVCNAIAYAHSRGVMHRDLKPENVVLGRFGEVFVVDWGLAKIAGSADWGSSTIALCERPPLKDTMPGSLMGTPAYMAPEQATGSADAIDTRTDIYGLGAILYVILTGQPPHRGETCSEIIDHAANNKLTPPRLLNRAVPEELEAICLKAMAKLPGDRYQSATELAQEVHRWMADEPLQAFREPVRSRARRWLLRHRVQVMLVCMLALAVAVPSYMARKHWHSMERLRAVQARDAGQARFARFHKLAADAHFYGLAGPMADLGEARRTCDKALALYGVDSVEQLSELHDSSLDPAQLEQLQQELAQLFVLRLCLEVAGGADRKSTAVALQRFEQLGLESRVLADYFRAEEHRARDELEDAIACYQRVLASEPQNYWALSGLGHCYLRTGQPRLAWLAYQTCIGLQPRSPWPWTQRGVAAALAEDADLALQDLRHALDIEPDFMPARFNLALVYSMRNDHQAAIDEFTACLNAAPRAAILNARAKCWLALNELARARDDVEAALRLQPGFAAALVTRASIQSLGANDGDVEPLRTALEDLDKALVHAPGLLEVHIERAKVLEALGSVGEAVHAYGRALEIVRFDPAILRQRARLLVESGRKREAVADYTVLVRAGRASADDLRHSGACHADLELWREAIADYSAALQIQPDHPASLLGRAQCHAAQKNFAAALADCDRLLRLDPLDPAAQALKARIHGMQSAN